MKEQSGHSNYSELERIMKIMEPYIQSCPLYDIVRSDKFGYLLISMPAGDQIDDAELIPWIVQRHCFVNSIRTCPMILCSRRGTA